MRKNKQGVEIEESEFGKGCTYCLGMFLAHQFQMSSEMKSNLVRPESWFNASSDHFYELQPTGKDVEIDQRLMELKQKCLSWGHGFGYDGRATATEDDKQWALQEAKELLRLIDERLLNITTMKGELE
jgi:hypothetical protein